MKKQNIHSVEEAFKSHLINKEQKKIILGGNRTKRRTILIE